MNLRMTVIREKDNCHFFADTDYDKDSFVMSARPATFVRRAIFQDDSETDGLLTLPLVDAKKMAEEILKL